MKASEEVRHSGIGKTVEYRFRHKNGTWVALESTSSAIRNTEGETEKLIFGNRDITERKRTEEALLRSEGGFGSVGEDSHNGSYRARPTGLVLTVNPTLNNM